jgi:hypothetical protein
MGNEDEGNSRVRDGDDVFDKFFSVLKLIEFDSIKHGKYLFK